MLTVLIQSFFLASAGFFSVGSITLVILFLLSERGWRNGLNYALGYLSAYTLIGLFAVVLGYSASGGKPSKLEQTSPILLMALGLLLFGLTFRNWRKPISEKAQPPRFFAIVDSITPPKAFAFGVLVTVMNFKNLALFLSALSVIILSGLPFAQKLTLVFPVALTFCFAVIIPVLIYLAFPSNAASLLNRIKHALEVHSRAIGIWMPLFFGSIFLIRGWMLL